MRETLKKLTITIVMAGMIALALSSTVGATNYIVPQEQWNKAYEGIGNNNDFGYSARQTSDGGYIFAGQMNNAGSYIWLVKTDANGTMQWNNTFGGGYSDIARSVQQTSDGGYIIAGSTYRAGSDAWVIKTDSKGKEEWNYTHGGLKYDDAWFIIQTSDEGFIFTGGTYSYGGTNDAWAVKLYPNGTEQWNKIYRTNTRGQSIRQTPDGGYIIAGRTYPWGASYNSDAYLLKIDADGKEQWSDTYGTDGHEDAAYSVDLTPDEGYIFAGTTSSLGAGVNDAWLVKVNSSGKEQWNNTFGEANYDYGYSTQRTLDNGYVIAGLTQTYGPSGNKGWLVKFDENGSKLWNMSFGGIKTDGIYSVQQTLDGGYILGGSTQTYAAHFTDAWLIKVSSDTDISTPTPVLTTVLTSPLSTTLNITETQVFTATALDQDIKPMPGVNISWTVSNSTVGNVDALYGITDINGNVSTTFTATAAGTSNITAINESVSGLSTVIVLEPASTETPTPTPTESPTPTPSPSPTPTPINSKPEILPGFNQFKSNGVTLIEVNNKTIEKTVLFKATAKDLDNDQVRLQIELRRIDENGGQFNENLGGLKTSDLVPSGSQITISVSGLIDGNYHWRLRAVDANGNKGDWQEFGNNNILSADFIVSQYNHWVAVIPVQLGAPNTVDYQAIVKRTNDLTTYYAQQSYGKEKLKADILLNGNYAYTSETYSMYLASKDNDVEKARQQIVSDAMDYVENEMHINLVPYDAVVVVAAGNIGNLAAVGCSFKSRYPDINGGPKCKKSWALIPENRLSNAWVHEVGHAVFDFTDKYGASVETGGTGGNINYWGIMGSASGPGPASNYLDPNPISPVDPISKRDAGWIDEMEIGYGMHQPINLISNKGIYFFNPDNGDPEYIIEGRYPFDNAISDGWCVNGMLGFGNPCGKKITSSNPLKKTKGVLIYRYNRSVEVTAPKIGTTYSVDQIFNIINPAVGKGDIPQYTVTLIPGKPSKSTIDIAGTRFRVTESKGQLYLDISKI